MVRLLKINNEKVNAIPLEHQDKRPVKGQKIIPECYANILLCAKKKSGKTSVIFKILKDCVGKNTIIIAFVATLDKDDNWIAIRKSFEEKGTPFVGYTSLKNEQGVDQLDLLVQHLKNEAKDIQEQDHKPKTKTKTCLVSFDDNENSDDEEKPKRKSKYLAPEYIIILDDLSNELKSPSLVTLLKNNRHFKSKVIISTQYLNDLLPSSRKQLDVVILFKSLPIKKLEEIYKDTDLSIPFDNFVQLYQIATEKPYSFLYIDTRNEVFRQNFDKVFV